MRFIEGGPDLPDALLVARDEGKVLFFCGAGVSLAQAKLPTFVSLAGAVIDRLGSSSKSPARRLFRAATTPLPDGQKTSVPVDRIFGFLDQEFDGRDVRDAVAEALKPIAAPDLGAHQVLLDLSRDPGGRPRLITTNFDHLFEAADASLPTWGPPNLPLPDRPNDFQGIIHLHGRVDPSYEKGSDDDLVLSSRDFGRAYLSDGWATRYIRRIIETHELVFVGYSADDPPVQYLLEALREDNASAKMYAFQSGDDAQANEQWAHKGVRPIAYGDDHARLWATLEAWAVRARDVSGWYSQVIDEARDGPQALSPHRRGVIAHLASTLPGARKIAASEIVLPASWLFSFDPQVRFGRPHPVDLYDPNSPQIDPFDHFALDFDIAPRPIQPDDYLTARTVPADAWDGFTAGAADLAESEPSGLARIVSNGRSEPPLPPRLGYLEGWLTKVVGQTASLWWAAGKPGLHERIVRTIEWTLGRGVEVSPELARYWRHLLTAWRDVRANADQQQTAIKGRAAKDGWSAELIRQAVGIYRPRIFVSRASAVPPPTDPAATPDQCITLGVEYPRPHAGFAFPPEYLGVAISAWRALMVLAAELEATAHGHGDPYFDTTRPDDGARLDAAGYGLTGLMVGFTHLVEAQEAADPAAARAEYASWHNLEGSVFERFRIWGAGRPGLSSAVQAAALFAELPDEVFWGSRHERDLYFAIRDRWPSLSDDARAAIEKGILEGPIPYLHGDDAETMAARYRLTAIQWFEDQGVEFTSFDPVAERTRLSQLDPDWRKEFTEGMAQPHVSGPYSVETNADPTSIIDLPFGEVLPIKSSQERGAGRRIHYDPFAGLAEKKPVRALLALHSALDRGLSTPQEWQALLRIAQKDAVPQRFDRAIACLVARLPPLEVSKIWYPLADWLVAKASRMLAAQDPAFGLVWDATLAAARIVPSPYPQKPDRRWSDEALNAPVGRLARAMFEDSGAKHIAPGSGLPPLWQKRLAGLLSTSGDHKRHALNIIARRAAWLHQTDANWTRTNLVAAANSDGHDADAFWAGFAAGAQSPQDALFVELKGTMLARAVQDSKGRDETNVLPGMLLSGWGRRHGTAEPPIVSDEELRDLLILGNEDARAAVLTYLGKWAREEASDWNQRVMPFLQRVWPKQRSVRTNASSINLVRLAVELPKQLASIVPVIAKRLVAASAGQFLHLPNTLEAFDAAGVDALVELMLIVLPPSGRDWPYDAPETLKALLQLPHLQHDARLAELQRRSATNS